MHYRLLTQILVGVGVIGAFVALPTQLPADSMRRPAPNFSLSDSNGAQGSASRFLGHMVPWMQD